MNKDGITVCVHMLVSPVINHCMFICKHVYMHISVKNGWEESKLSACFEGQLHKQLACLRI